jgi:hypothetical protein
MRDVQVCYREVSQGVLHYGYDWLFHRACTNATVIHPKFK